MLLILLCGGAGTRFDNIFPKPLNLVQGHPMIYHVISKLATKDITIIYNSILDEYGFCTYLLNTFGGITFTFVSVDFQTRGPAETLYVGLSKISRTQYNQQVVVLDNDNIYEGLVLDQLPKGNFVLYNDNPTGLYHYSFVQVNQQVITDIQERNPISNSICVGGYGFENVGICMDYCKEVILHSATEEPYMSKVMKKLLENNYKVHAYYVPGVFSIGTPKDILLNLSKIPTHKIRAVFDLDNTIVTYPTLYKDYQTVQPIPHVLQFIKYLKANGHEVIIYTARNMVRSGNNLGKVMKNVAKTTIETLEKLGVEYDELHFGKPYGDIYIDDKAFNTYDINMLQQLGFYDTENSILASNYRTNKYNYITRINKHQIRKTGPDLSGEIFFYQIILNHASLQPLFPKFFTHDHQNSILLEFINGTPLSKIYCEGLLQESLLKQLLSTIYEFHQVIVDDKKEMTEEIVYHHYVDKFEQRSKKKEDYPFEDFKEVYTVIQSQLQEFLQKKYPINSIIHGDLWFSNIMYYKNQFIFYDMRGKMLDILTVKGHIFYDYAKIYQSIVGLDSIILYNEHISSDIREKMEQVFWEFLLEKGIIHLGEASMVKHLTGYLIYNTFHAYDSEFECSKKEKIWELVKECIA
jgi:capsule biosynthesis phosphatase